MNSCNKKKQNINRSLRSFIHDKAIQYQRAVNELLISCSWPVSLLACLMFCSMVMGQTSTKQTQKKSEPLPEMSAKVYGKVSPVIVRLDCKKGAIKGSGSIVGLTKEGRAIILTACHVVAANYEDAKSDDDLPLEFYKDIQVKVAARVSSVRGVAIPKFANRSLDLALVVTAASVAEDQVIGYTVGDKVKPGQVVAAFGFPKADELSQTVGRVTRLQSNYIVFDAQIAPGSSGGPLIDKSGRMVGVSLLTEQQEGNALHINVVAPVVNNWLTGLKLKNVWRHENGNIPTWQLIAGGIAVGGGIVTYSVLSSNNSQDEGKFPAPPGRPDGN